ncbi:MAG: carboxypeptidase-like regulatory domain-containing protein, partial [Bacteroidota bacterium]|nr:carboxypeptidase-like regulatory domain-containing protein [Bacteroidota bacterium]
MEKLKLNKIKSNKKLASASFFFTKNMNLKKIYLSLLFLIPASLFAQTGIIRGTVIDGDLGEPLFGANVLIENGSGGAITDFDGKFEINIAPGTYNLNITFIGLADAKITEVQVVLDQVTLIDNVVLQAKSNQLKTFTVSANVIRNTEAAMINIKKKSASVMDGISAAKFRRIGDSDAASAIKRVTGVSVESGKYVYVRGLGDRYTKTMLNGLDIPGLDPDRNSIQIDIFPTSLIGNMTVLKSASAEFPADFTGGIVNIET